MWERGPFAPLDLHLVGADPSAPTASGLWPSDHAGVVVTLEIGPQAAPAGRPTNGVPSGTSSDSGTSPAAPAPAPTGW